MSSGKNSLRIIIQKAFVALTVLAISYSCNLYDDNFGLVLPSPIVHTHTFPGIVVIELTQSAEESANVPSLDTQLEMNVTKLSEDVSGDFALVIKLYNQTPLTNENVGFIKIIRIREFESMDEVSIDLGNSYATPLRKELIEIKIIDGGIDSAIQSLSRGYYTGIYALVEEGDTILAGNVFGTIDYQGELSFELKGVAEFRFLRGQSVDKAPQLDVYGNVMEVDGQDYSPIHGRLIRVDSVLKGPIPLNSSDYDTIQLNLVKKLF